MKLSCNIVQDLLPLYEDGLCSEESRTSIEEHLKECQECREFLENMREFLEPDIAEIIVSNEEQIVAKSFRKVRRRWRTSLVAMLLILPMLVMSVNQIRGIGICFTNADDILLVGRYVRALEKGDYEKVASYMDYEHEYQQVLSHLKLKLKNSDLGQEKYQEFSKMSLEEFTDFMKEYYVEHLETAMDSGFHVKNKGYDECYYLEENGHWTIGYSMEISYNGKAYPVTAWFCVDNGRIINLAAMSWKGEYLDETEDSLTEALILDYPIWDE